jgi:hypothetical protein
MKTPEDEAFDELARKQGAWGGGFQAKRKMAADKLHWSDCAVHNAPAYPAGKCDCGVEQEPEREALKLALEALEESQTDNDTMEFWDRKSKAITAIKEALAQPAQGPAAMNDRQRLEAIVSVINKYLPPLGMHIMDAMSAIISLVDPLPPPQRERVVFPTMLRKMWSGGEVQAWLDENVNKEKNA